MRHRLAVLALAAAGLLAPFGIGATPAAAHTSYAYVARGSCVFEGWWTVCNTGLSCYRGTVYKHTYRPTGYTHQVCKG